MFNKILTTIICFALTIPYCPETYADEFMDNAVNLVENSKKLAEADANFLLEADLATVLNKLIVQISKLEENDKFYQSFNQAISNLNSSFETIAKDLSRDDIDKAYDSFHKYWDAYKQAIFRRFEASFQPNIHRQSREQVLASTIEILKEFKALCKTGRASITNSYMPDSFVEAPDSSIYIQPNFQVSSKVIGDFSIGLSANADSGSNSKANRDRRNLVVNTTATANYTIGALMLSEAGKKAGESFIANLSGTANTFLASYASTIFVASAVIIIASMMEAKREKDRMLKKMAKAQVYKFENMSTYKTVADHYTAACKEKESIFDRVIFLLENIGDPLIQQEVESNVEKNQKLLNEYITTSMHHKEWKCIESLEELISSDKCVNFSTYENLRVQQDPELQKVFCVIRDSNYYPLQGWREKDNSLTCSLPFNAVNRAKIVEDAKKSSEKFDADFSYQKLSNIIGYPLANSIIQSHKKNQDMYLTEFNKIDEKARRAFIYILRYLEQVKEANKFSESATYLREVEVSRKISEVIVGHQKLLKRFRKVFLHGAVDELLLGDIRKLKKSADVLARREVDIEWIRVISKLIRELETLTMEIAK